MLTVTPKYLSEVVAEHTGKNPTDHILDMEILEAKVMLRHTDKAVGKSGFTWVIPIRPILERCLKNLPAQAH